MLVSVEPGLIIWTIVTFLVLVFLLGRFGWKPLLSALEQRESGIRNALEEARRARSEAEAALRRNEELIVKAETEAREIVQAAREISEQLRRESEVETRAEAQRLLDQARRDIQQAKEAALREVKETVADLAVQAAGRIILENLDANRHRKMVDDLINRLPETKTT
jgi:F-type H+-transporting ATPase subunit b